MRKRNDPLKAPESILAAAQSGAEWAWERIYGEWVKLEPTAEGMNLTLWILPAVALVVGVIFAVAFARRSRRDEAKAPAKKESSGDPYLDAIREEVDQ